MRVTFFAWRIDVTSSHHLSLLCHRHFYFGVCDAPASITLPFPLITIYASGHWRRGRRNARCDGVTAATTRRVSALSSVRHWPSRLSPRYCLPPSPPTAASPLCRTCRDMDVGRRGRELLDVAGNDRRCRATALRRKPTRGAGETWHDAYASTPSATRVNKMQRATWRRRRCYCTASWHAHNRKTPAMAQAWCGAVTCWRLEPAASCSHWCQRL